MKQVIHTGLPALAQPLSWAVRAGGMVFTTHGPVKHYGQMELGPFELQARLSLNNLQQALQAAGSDLADVAQVLIYLTDIADLRAVDAVYPEFFEAPYPKRSAVAVTALAVPGMRIELVAYACIEGAPSVPGQAHACALAVFDASTSCGGPHGHCLAQAAEDGGQLGRAGAQPLGGPDQPGRCAGPDCQRPRRGQQGLRPDARGRRFWRAAGGRFWLLQPPPHPAAERARPGALAQKRWSLATAAGLRALL